MSLAHLLSRCSALTLLFALCTQATAQGGISIDHDFSDWSTIPSVAVEDTVGPLVSVGFTSDAERVYFHLLYDRIIALDEGLIPHGTKLALDLDGNASTGQIAGSFQGAELVIHLKDRYVNTSADGGSVAQSSLNDAQVRMAPTYGGMEHEVSIDRSASGFSSVSAPIRWSVQCSASGQQVTSEASVSLSNDEAVAVATPLARSEDAEFRVAFWNMNRRLNDTGAQEAMGRILGAVQPDILAMSEVEDFSEEHVQSLLDDWMPIEDGQWHVAKDDWDLMVASRWPITAEFSDVYRQFPVLIDAGGSGEIMVAASHLKCCNGADQRQSEADEYMAFLRDAMTEGGDLDLATKTPVIYGGDLNMVGPGHAMHTLLTGDIANEAANGPDFAPDWDGTGLRELQGLQTDQAMNYTWLNTNSQWPAGKLDYMLIQDGVLEVLGDFTLETASMTPERRAQFGLEAGDDMEASDHLIVVADLRRHDRPGTKPVKVLKRLD
jgi:endonuclease/exonuclease/phosphatase family metal-dependent hydrolase